ncbi:proteinase inhibitor-like [Drosophila nasuta]|uniref:proteinase inhibitor-like n=1 Tax=Drosophila nasuta TaxID=42062 RepID=UPI00295EA0FE|nr:proteinase inhibitor-like [Drosophila nasuta]
MKTSLLPVFALLLIYLMTSYAYNAKKCNAKPSETGPCKAAFPMWRFIKATRQCESFLYGGCKGTKNLFEDEEECIAQCLT